MGACLSSVTKSIHDDIDRSHSALVISPKGDLHPYPTPVFVSDVLQIEDDVCGSDSSSSPSSSSLFVCNSDTLYYDELITPLDLEAELDAGQIYFLLPKNKLQQPLSTSDMAALAVKASTALNSKATTSGSSSFSSRTRPNNNNNTRSRNGNGGNGRKRKNNNRARISPFVVMETSQIDVIVEEELTQNKRFSSSDNNNYSNHQNGGLGVSRSGSIRKLQRYSSRKARFDVRSFELRLSTIYETENSDQAQVY